MTLLSSPNTFFKKRAVAAQDSETGFFFLGKTVVFSFRVRVLCSAL